MTKTAKIMLRRVGLALGFWAVFMLPAIAAELMTRRMDLDGDGSKEADVYFDKKIITLATIDRNQDQQPDVTIHYKNGHRDFADIDTDFDGRPDMTIVYYFTGVPTAMKIDKNRDGRSDMWIYFQNGFIYRREWDRNFDGKPDYRVLFERKDDFRMTADGKEQRVDKQYDDNFDGIFEKSVPVYKRLPMKRMGLAPGDVTEIAS